MTRAETGQVNQSQLDQPDNNSCISQEYGHTANHVARGTAVTSDAGMKEPQRRHRVCLRAGALALALAACSGPEVLQAVLPIAEEGQEIEGFRELCDTQGGLHVTRTVDGVDGFVKLPTRDFLKGPDMPPTNQGLGGRFPCLDYLARDGFAFVEAEFRKPKKHLIGAFHYPTQDGLYRFRLVPRSSGLCERFDYFLRTSNWVQREAELYKEQLGDRCIHAERIPALTAQYQSEFNLVVMGQPRYQGEKGVILKWQYLIRNRVTGEILAEDNAFAYQNSNFVNRHLGNCHMGVPLDVAKILRPMPTAASRKNRDEREDRP